MQIIAVHAIYQDTCFIMRHVFNRTVGSLAYNGTSDLSWACPQMVTRMINARRFLMVEGMYHHWGDIPRGLSHPFFMREGLLLGKMNHVKEMSAHVYS